MFCDRPQSAHLDSKDGEASSSAGTHLRSPSADAGNEKMGPTVRGIRSRGSPWAHFR